MLSFSQNGVAHAEPGPRVLLHGPVLARDPLDAVLAMGRDASRVVSYTLIGAMLLHAGLVVRAEVIPIELMNWSRAIGREVHYRIYETYEVELLKPQQAPEPPHPEPEPVKEEPKLPPPIAIKETTPPPAAPAAAKAGAVLTAPANPDEPANFDGIISGTGETFAGGNTSAAGTSDTAVRTKPAAVGGVPGGTGTAPTGPATSVDKSRTAGVSGSKDWNCPFPPEADSDQIDQAFPTIQVSVRPDGTPERVTVLSDPGHGFGRAASRCAMQQRFDAALDRDGTPIAGMTKSLRVRFER
jgi:periplasmic protein TonB